MVEWKINLSTVNEYNYRVTKGICMFKLLKKIKPFIIYFASILIFALLYYLLYCNKPDSFVASNNINNLPLDSVYGYLFMGERPPTVGQVNFEDVSESLWGLLAKLNHNEIEIQNYRELILDREEQVKTVYEELEAGRQRNFETFRQEALRNFDEEGDSLKKAILDYEVHVYFLDNLKSFAPAELSAQLYDINEDIDKLRESLFDRITLEKKLRSELSALFSHSRREYGGVLNYIDFLYYSAGIATTTTFGDVTANSRSVRGLVIIQLLLSIVLLAAVINKVFELNVNKINS